MTAVDIIIAAVAGAGWTAYLLVLVAALRRTRDQPGHTTRVAITTGVLVLAVTLGVATYWAVSTTP